MAEHRSQAEGSECVCAVEEGALEGTIPDKGRSDLRAQMQGGAQPVGTRESQASAVLLRILKDLELHPGSRGDPGEV